MFHDRSLLERCFLGFVLPVLDYCSAVWFSAANAHLKLLDRTVSGARFLTGCVFECDIAHRRSVAVLCMLYKIRCKHLMMLYLDLDPLNDALLGLNYALPLPRRALVAHRYTFVLPHCRTSQHHRTLFRSQCSSGAILLTLYSMVWDWWISRAGPMLFYWPKVLYPCYSLLLFFPFPSFGL